MREKPAKIIRNKMPWFWIWTILLMAAPRALRAQQNLIGVPPFQPAQSNLEGVMELNGLSEQIPIPVYSKAGRGLPFTYKLIYSPNIWIGTPNGTWIPTNDWGWQGTQPTSPQYLGAGTGGVITYSSTVGGPCVYGNYPNFSYWYWTQYSNFVYYDPQGNAHSLGSYAFIYNPSPPCGPSTSSSYPNVLTDNSGLTVTISLSGNSSEPMQAQVLTRGGKVLNPEFVNSSNTSQTESTVYDRNGNEITTTQQSGFPTTWTDTLGQTVLSAAGSGTPSSPLVFSWNNAQSQQEAVTVNYQNYNIHTNFGCSGISEYSASSVALVSSIVLADGSKYTFSYEPTPGYSGDVTGRLASITLPTGGTVSYAWGPPDCSGADGQITSFTRTLPDGQIWQYSENYASESTITVTDPNNNQTVYSEGGYLDQIKSYRGSSATGTLLQTQEYCYDTTATAPGGAMPSCTSSSGTGEVNSLDTYVALGNQQSESVATFDTLGNMTEADNYDYGTNVIGGEIHSIITSYDSFSNSYGNFEEPATVEITTGGTSGTLLAKTSYAYDQNALAASGASQLVNVGSARGNPTTITYETSAAGPTTLSRTFTYFDTGMVDTATDVNGASSSFSYGCNGAFPTQINLPLSQSVSYTYNCAGGVVTSATDVNGNQTAFSYGSDPYWRALSVTDPMGNTMNNTYTPASGSSLASDESKLVFNSGNSAVDQMVSFDSQGRPEFSQIRQAPTSINYDSVQTLYSNTNSLWTVQSTIPYVGSADAVGPSTYSNTSNFDALGRPDETTSGSGGTLSYVYNDNDVLETAASPTVAKQLQFDAMGRLTSVCEITSNLPGNNSCGQTYPANGLETQYAYDTGGKINYVVTENAQNPSNEESRTFIYDMLGRLTSESNPENGTTYYYYDSTPSGSSCSSYTSNGDLVETVDGAGNVTCYQYDKDHRVTEISYVAVTSFSTAPTKYFVYDAASLNGTSMANAAGRLAEAYTVLNGSTQTAEFFSYDKDGNITDTWESTPNSGGYDHIAASYWANGLPDQLSVPGVPTLTYTPDGEGRVSSVSANGTNLLTSASYAIGTSDFTATLTYGSGDSDTAYTDLASGEPLEYQFDINGSTDTGNLSWNSNGTLASLDITDNLNSADSQNCSFSYDDLGRLGSDTGNAGVNCGSNWAQDYNFDSFGNITTSGSLSFQPSSYSNNQIQGWSLNGQSVTYNSDGDLTQDPFHTFSWYASNELQAVDSVSLIRDALGRVVEIDGSSNQEVLYAPFGGKIALMSGSSLNTAWIPLADGAEAVYNSSGLVYYRHPCQN